MKVGRPPLFRKRQFEPSIIVTCVRWYCRFSLSLRDLEELMAERGLSVDHTTIWRWVQRYGPEVHRRLRGNVKHKSSTWHIDETFVRIAGRWLYLFRAVDSQGQTVDFFLSETRDREAAKRFLKKALSNPDNLPPHVFARDGLRSYPAAIRELQNEGLMHRHCRHRTRPYANSRTEEDSCVTPLAPLRKLTLSFVDSSFVQKQNESCDTSNGHSRCMLWHAPQQ
jgi:transposase, IS6 family